MKKILVFSDTHGWPSRLISTARSEMPADACFFLGDGASDADALQKAFPHLPLYRVRGNCDFGPSGPEQALVPMDGVLFFLAHGHHFGVKHTLGAIHQAAQQAGASAALFGHSHLPHYQLDRGIHLFNPGSLAAPRSGKPSYGVITLQDSVPSFEIRYI